MDRDSTHPTLAGTHIRLEPLERAHIPGLVAAAGPDLALYQWSAVPIGTAQIARYVESAPTAREAGTAGPLATVRGAAGAVAGPSRLFDIGRWSWPPGHPADTHTRPA